MQSESISPAQPPVTPAGLLRRLGAMVSDSLVVVGLLLLITLLVAVPVLNALNKKAMVPSEVGWLWTWLYWALVLLVWGGYFVGFWARGGQTVGMRAWRIRVQTHGGQQLSYGQAWQRLGLALLPWLPGYLALFLADFFQFGWGKWLGQALLLLGVASLASMLFRPTKQMWHDHIAGQQVILLPKL